MPASANGWSANDRSVIASYDLPGGRVALRKGDVSVVLLWCANEWHRTVEPLVWPGIWGYAERTIRGSSTTLSNHASGTAIDCNAPQHPLGTAITANFSAAEIHAVRRIVAFCEGVIRWGGDYVNRRDGMHLEINSGAEAVKRIADKIRSGVAPSIPVTPGGGVPDRILELTTPFMRGDDVLAVQVAVGVPVAERDGMYGPDTERRVRAFQQSRGLTVDGQVGPQTRAAIRAVSAPAPAPRPSPAPAPSGGASMAVRDEVWQTPLPDYYTANSDDRMWASECLAWGTTHAAHARDAAREALAKATTLESKVDALLARVVSGGTANPGGLSDADMARIAAVVAPAVAAELSKRLTA